jgi:hypothetical protein
MSVEIDWENLATRLGLLTKDGGHCGSDDARRALELIVGEEALRASVDYYIAARPGSELARFVLWQLQPWSAMSYCYEIFRGQSAIETRRMAVELVRVVADRRALPWILEFLEDQDADIQSWGVGVLDQMLWSQRVEPEEAEDLLKKAESHENNAVREQAGFVRGYLLARAKADKPCERDEGAGDK